MRYFFSLFILLLSLTSLGQKKECNCLRYVTGSFYTLGPNDSEPDTLFIERTASYQTEISGKDYNRKHQVIWLSSCKYLLRDANVHTKKKVHPSDVFVKIIETTDDFYVVEAWAPRNKKMVMTIYVRK